MFRSGYDTEPLDQTYRRDYAPTPGSRHAGEVRVCEAKPINRFSVCICFPAPRMNSWALNGFGGCAIIKSVGHKGGSDLSQIGHRSRCLSLCPRRGRPHPARLREAPLLKERGGEEILSPRETGVGFFREKAPGSVVNQELSLSMYLPQEHRTMIYILQKSVTNLSQDRCFSVVPEARVELAHPYGY